MYNLSDCFTQFTETLEISATLTLHIYNEIMRVQCACLWSRSDVLDYCLVQHHGLDHCLSGNGLKSIP